MKISRQQLTVLGSALLVVAAVRVFYTSSADRPVVATNLPPTRFSMPPGSGSQDRPLIRHSSLSAGQFDVPSSEIDEMTAIAGSDSRIELRRNGATDSSPAGDSKQAHVDFPDGYSDSRTQFQSTNTPDFNAESASSTTQAWRPFDPATPGGQLSFDGRIANVTASQANPGSDSVSLALMLEEVTSVPSPIVASPEVPSSPGISPASTAISISDASDAAKGFTYEQELFRTKWGWAAYDQVQRVLREETSD